MPFRGFSYKGIHSSSFGLLVNRVSRSILPQLNEKIVTIPDRPGGYWFGNEMGVREFQIDVTFIEATDTDLIQKVRDVAKWLLDDGDEHELVFDSEPDKTYYAIFTGQSALETLGSTGTATLRFICPDPFAYGPEIESVPITLSPFSFTPEGQMKTSPIFVVNFTQPSTFFSMATKDKYIHIGSAESAEQTTLPREEILIEDNMNSTTDWQVYSNVEGGTATGSFYAPDGSFKAQSYGSGTIWHGPCLKKMASQTAQDFRFEAVVGFFANQQNEVGRMEIYLLDQGSSIIGKMAIRDAWADETTIMEARVGNMYSGKPIIEHVGKKWKVKKTRKVAKKVHGRTKYVTETYYEGFSQHSDFYGKLKMERIGQNWKASVIRLDQKTGREVDKIEVKFTDTQNQYQTPIAGIAIHFAQYGTAPPIANMYVTYVKLTKWNQNITEEVPKIFLPGDELLIDCESGGIYKNGDVWMEELNIGSEFFEFEGGQTHTIAFEPQDKCSVKIFHRGRYL